MKEKRKDTSPIVRAIGLLVSVMMMSTIALPVAADELSDNHHIYIPMANTARFNDYGNNTYYFKFDGGGLNALHISDDYNSEAGQVTQSTQTSGTFFFTDTGGRGYDDDAILMIAVNGTIPENFRITINSSGYQWLPTDGTIPDEEAVEKYEFGEIFDSGDFLNNISQIWKPYTTAGYPIFYGQNMSDTGNTFQLMFVDLNVGILGNNVSYADTLDNHGAVMVNYTIENAPDFLAFDAYAYCFISNQSQGVSWTNRVSGTGSSGWTVIP